MNLPGLVLFFILLGPAFAFANSMGVFVAQVPGSTTIGWQAILAPLGCVGTPISLTCVANIAIPAIIFATALTFGYFLWGLAGSASVLAIFVSAIQLPYAYLRYWGIPDSLILVFFTAEAFVLLMWAYTLITNRYNSEVF